MLWYRVGLYYDVQTRSGSAKDPTNQRALEAFGKAAHQLRHSLAHGGCVPGFVRHLYMRIGFHFRIKGLVEQSKQVLTCLPRLVLRVGPAAARR